MRNRMTVGDLRRLIENVPDETPVLLEASDHEYRAVYKSGIAYSTALDHGDHHYFTEDVFIPEGGEGPDGIGEVTEYGTRVRALLIQ